ncbi:hypothetical protein GQ42DRAFT_93492 [Ramicandelaber brevisporus]|nr:hypothetical protein GQ42DRAFT_93492 [Ramicandelaber brevisporus]
MTYHLSVCLMSNTCLSMKFNWRSHTLLLLFYSQYSSGITLFDFRDTRTFFFEACFWRKTSSTILFALFSLSVSLHFFSYLLLLRTKLRFASKVRKKSQETAENTQPRTTHYFILCDTFCFRLPKPPLCPHPDFHCSTSLENPPAIFCFLLFECQYLCTTCSSPRKERLFDSFPV